jgi:hypothetical protein
MVTGPPSLSLSFFSAEADWPVADDSRAGGKAEAGCGMAGGASAFVEAVVEGVAGMSGSTGTKCACERSLLRGGIVAEGRITKADAVVDSLKTALTS